MHFIEISNIFKSEKKRYKVTAVLKLLVMFALLGFFLSNKPMYHVQTDFYLKRMGFVFLACFSADTVLSERATLDRSKSCNDHFGGSADHIFDEQHQSWISDRTICIVYLCGSCMCCI